MKNLTRRIISLFLSAVIACGCMLAASAAEVRYGDADGDGLVNAGDALTVLEHSVKKKTITGSRLTKADVNGDGSVNSLDALSILQLTVGKITKFEADPSFVPQTGDEILAAYASAVKKTREEKPAYMLTNDTYCTKADVKVSDPFSLLKLAGMDKSELEQETKQEAMDSINMYPHYESAIPKNSTYSLENLPSVCSLKDSSKLKSISMYVQPNGNYVVTIKFNDEKNPKSTGPLCKVMGVSDYESTLAELEESAKEDGEEIADVKLDELSYKNAWITCEINPYENNLVDYQFGFNCYTVSTITALSIGFATAITVENTGSCSGFEY